MPYNSKIFTETLSVPATAPGISPNTAEPAAKPAPSAEKAKPDTAADMPAHGDKSIWGIFIMLCLISVIELYSASSREVAAAGVYGPIMRHVFFLTLAFGIIWGLEKVHYKWFFAGAYAFAGISLIMMIYTSVAGDVINGARRSFHLGPMSIQPSEFIKISAVFVIAKVMACSQKAKEVGVHNKAIITGAAVVVVFGALLYPQGLTNTGLLLAIWMAMMTIGGTEYKKLFLIVAIIGTLGYGAHKFQKWQLEKSRMEAALAIADNPGTEGIDLNRSGLREGRLARYNPFAAKYKDSITADNRQEMYSYMAQANGGIIGVFPGNSRETARLPLAFSDYIFAIVLEDIGFVGGMFLLILYLWLLARAGVIARKCHRAFPALLVMGMAVMIVLQALFHMAITTGAFPVSGQPLPLISKGGTSILITAIALGAMLSVSRSAVQNGTRQEVKEELNQLPEELHASNPTQL
ncbi:FtsW/RodA/SpoVE family cell cycle protein [Muribaculum sp.]|jgi:cell division protein FtsW|uniref:FtsW/RodA/SpoVE family cell cycle protein n=2 Tax=Muribaculum TaxID=1918540 RepID=UPI00257DE857|nr:FtsW/RodA/SpoVE family cell cycle protein [Muribaculum sp.]